MGRKRTLRTYAGTHNDHFLDPNSRRGAAIVRKLAEGISDASIRPTREQQAHHLLMSTHKGVVQCGTTHIAELVDILAAIKKKGDGPHIAPPRCDMKKMISIRVDIRHGIYWSARVFIDIVD
jgi:hypothetical protein